jgi:alpha 1,3-glucosidase
MKNDPFTLTIVTTSPSNSATLAQGELYMDDGETYVHTTHGDLLWRRFQLETVIVGDAQSLKLSSRDLVKSSVAAGTPIVDANANSLFLGSTAEAANATFVKYDAVANPFIKSVEKVVVEKIVVLGLTSAPRSITLGGEKLHYSFKSNVLIIRNPNISIVKDWVIIIDSDPFSSSQSCCKIL